MKLRAPDKEEFRKRTQDHVARLLRGTWYHSIQLPDGTVVPGHIGIDALQNRLASLAVPEDLTGKRILDVGAATGWCAFEMERRGAEVVATDCVEFEEFHVARKFLGSKVEYHVLDVEELSPETLGVFDYVLFFGVLYHLRHPLLGLERICALTRDTAFVESFVIDSIESEQGSLSQDSLLQFYETDELGGQIDNWFGPNLSCLLALCRSAGFAHVDLKYVVDRRAGVVCRRRWDDCDPDPSQPGPWITSAVNNRTQQIYFHKGKDEYICVYFKSSQQGLTKDRLRVEIDGYGVPLIKLSAFGQGGWQVNMKLPPGLRPGPHELRLRAVDSKYSNCFCIVVDPGEEQLRHHAEFLPLERANAPAPHVFEVENSMDGSRQFYGYRNEYLCCYFRTPETGLKREDILVEVEGRVQPVLFLSDLGRGEWQTNSRVPGNLPTGSCSVRLRTAHSPYSNTAIIHFFREPTS